MLDIFKQSDFDLRSLTAAIQLLPFKPRFLRDIGLFDTRGIPTTQAVIELKDGFLALIPAKARGAQANVHQNPKRNTVTINTLHLPLEDSILADDVLGIRQFGSEDLLETLSGRVNEVLLNMGERIQTTLEHLRVGAIKGSLLDADGTTELLDLFDAFDQEQSTVDMNLDVAGTNVLEKVEEIWEAMNLALGDSTTTSAIGLAGKDFWASLRTHANVEPDPVRGAIGNWQASHPHQPFVFGGISWFRYRGQVGDTKFVEDDVAYIVPQGVPGLLIETYAPADFNETVNTMGQPLYAKMERQKYDRGMDLLVQSNPLMLNTRPNAVVKAYETAEPS